MGSRFIDRKQGSVTQNKEHMKMGKYYSKQYGLMVVVIEMGLAVLLAIGCGWIGRSYLADLNQGSSPISSIELLYGPAVMMAAGRDFYQPDIRYSVELRQFLRKERETLDPSDLPSVLPEDPNEVSSYHRYLLYVTAFFWKYLGISWASLEPLAALMFGCCAAAVYGLMRLGMGRFLSVILTLFFVLSPQMFVMMPSLRDFSKAPFILAIIFFLGFLLKYSWRFYCLILLSALLGSINGIAMGFRQDALVFVVPGLIILLISVIRLVNVPFWKRIVPPTVFIFLFLLFAYPMLQRMEGGAQPYHPIVQGFSMKRAASLGITPGIYEPLASGSDNYTFSMLYDYYRRTDQTSDTHFTFNSPGSEVAGLKFLLDMGVNLPADLLTRGYAALLRTLRYTDGITPWQVAKTVWTELFESSHFTLANHLRTWGIVYALLAFLLIASQNFLIAIGVLIFVLYVCGYVSLQCEFRHAFHLSFVPLWILGFLVQQLFSYLKKYLFAPRRIATCYAVVLRRVGLVFAGSALLVITPLAVLRIYQIYRVAPIIETVEHLPSQRIPLYVTEEFGWTKFLLRSETEQETRPTIDEEMTDFQALAFCIAAFLVSSGRDDSFPPWHVKSRYFALELKPNSNLEWLVLLYDSKIPWNNFSQLIRLHMPTSTQSNIFYFFPTFELKMPSEEGTFRNRFLGFAIPTFCKDSIVNLREVKEDDSLRFLFHITLPADKSKRKQLYQKIDFFPEPLDAFLVDDGPSGVFTLSEAATRLGKKQDADQFFRAALLIDRDPNRRLSIANWLLRLGNLEVARTIALDYLLQPGLQLEQQGAEYIIDAVLHHYDSTADTKELEWTLEALCNVWLPQFPDKLVERLSVFAHRSYHEFLLDIAKRILKACPGHTATTFFANTLLEKKESSDAITFWEDIVKTHPDSVFSLLYLGLAYEKQGKLDIAKKIFAEALSKDPSQKEIALRYLALSLGEDNYEEIIRKIEELVSSDPEQTPLAVQLLENAGDRWAVADNLDVACRIYTSAVQLSADEYALQLKLAHYLILLGRTDQAEKVLIPLLVSNEAARAAQMLDSIWERTRGPQQYLDSWYSMVVQYPMAPTAYRYYVNSLMSQGRYTEVQKVILDAAKTIQENPEIKAALLVSRLALGQSTKEEFLQDQLWTEYPDLRSHLRNWLVKAVTCAESANNHLLAEEIATTLAKLEPESEAVWRTLGRILEDKGDYEKALAVYCHVFPAKPINEQQQIATHIDTLFAKKNQTEERVAFWQSFQQQHPGNEVVRFHLGLAYEVNEQWDKAFIQYTDAPFYSEISFLARLREGHITILQEKIDEGIKQVQSAVEGKEELKPLCTMLLLQTGNTLLSKNRWADAERIFRFIIEIDPSNALGWLHLGDSLYSQGNVEQAWQCWLQVFQKGADTNVAAEVARRFDRYQSGNTRVLFWQDWVERLPNAVLPRTRYALALALTGDWNRSYDLCETLLTNNNDSTEVNLACGIVWCLVGRVQEGIQLLEKTLEKASYLTQEIHTYLALAADQRASKGFYADAELLLRKAIALGPDDLSYYLQLGKTLLAQNKYQEAKEQFRHVLTQMPESPNTANLFDEAWGKVQDVEGWRRGWEEIVNLYPESTIPRQHLEALR